jgi:hypothetical protein
MVHRTSLCCGNVCVAILAFCLGCSHGHGVGNDDAAQSGADASVRPGTDASSTEPGDAASQDPDARSAYYFKDRDEKLKAGPLWDYNFALGGVGAQDAAPEANSDPGLFGGTDTGWAFEGQRNVNNWYPKLTADRAFMAQVRTRYTELRQTLLSEAALEQRMTALATPLTQAVVRDFAKWPVSDIITSETGFTGGPTAPTWEGQLQVMRDFLVDRLAWIDANLP